MGDTDVQPPKISDGQKNPFPPLASARSLTTLSRARSREVFTFHRLEELLRLVSLDAQVRGKLKALPALDSSKLWSVQKRAIENLERSLAKNNPRSLIQMATGSGKTFTAVNACYRLIKFRRGEAGAVPRGPQQPRAADLLGVPAVREPRERLLEILIVISNSRPAVFALKTRLF